MADALPWIWAIEALARCEQVDTSFLHDLIMKAPEFPDDLGKNAREMVALRCLEDLFGPSNEITNDVSSALDSKIRFDSSESCEDVLQLILHVMSIPDLRVVGPELLKWDVRPFIMHKRACLPKCALEQLKDTILEVSHPYAALFRERSGLAIRHECDDRNPESEGCDLAKESQVGGLDGSGVYEDVRDEFVSPKIEQSNDVNDGVQHNQLQFCNNDKLPQDTSGDGPYQNISVDGVRGDVECRVEPKISKGATSNGPRKEVSVDAAKNNTEDSFHLKTPIDASPDGFNQKMIAGEAEDGIRHYCEEEMSSESDGYHNEKIDVTTKKHSFLSSQSTFSQDSSPTADWKEQNYCIKCNKDGQLLVCSDSGCPVAAHENCLGSSASFDSKGNFSCPFCAHSLAISEYLEAKKKASLARKQLAAFIGREIKHQRERAGHTGEHINQAANKQQAEPSVPCVNDNLSCRAEEATAIHGALCVFTEEKRRGKMVKECQSVGGFEGQHNKVPADCDYDGNNSCFNDTETILVSWKHAEVGIQQEVLRQQVTDHRLEPAGKANIDAEEEAYEDENDRSIDKSIASNYSIRSRSQERHCTYPVIPLSRRKKVTWTAEEEEILKEGVQRFSSVDDTSIPWKKILEYGGTVFQKGRTTVDLKDKWRNICKGSSKLK